MVGVAGLVVSVPLFSQEALLQLHLTPSSHASLAARAGVRHLLRWDPVTPVNVHTLPFDLLRALVAGSKGASKPRLAGYGAASESRTSSPR